MLELVRHGLRQWNERAGGGDPGGGAAEGGADAGEAAAEPRGAGRGAGQRGTGRAEQQSPAAGNARKEPERLGEGAPAPSSSSAAPRPPHPLPSAGPGRAWREEARPWRGGRRRLLHGFTGWTRLERRFGQRPGHRQDVGQYGPGSRRSSD